MPGTGSIVRLARQEQDLTQRELAERMGVSQPAVAKLEASGDEISVATLTRALHALGRRLEIRVTEPTGDVDETLVAANLRMSPEDRLRNFEGVYSFAREVSLAGERARRGAR